jgi:hypothetical protein
MHCQLNEVYVNVETQLEGIIQAVSSLPDESSARALLTSKLLSDLWDNLKHPPLSHTGDTFKYRTADGSYNVCFFPCLLGLKIRTLIVITPERDISPSWQGRLVLCSECDSPTSSPSTTSRPRYYLRWYESRNNMVENFL